MSNLEAVQRYLGGWNMRDAGAIFASLTDDGTYEDPGSGGPHFGEHFASMPPAYGQPSLTSASRSRASLGPGRIPPRRSG